MGFGINRVGASQLGSQVAKTTPELRRAADSLRILLQQNVKQYGSDYPFGAVDTSRPFQIKNGKVQVPVRPDARAQMERAGHTPQHVAAVIWELAEEGDVPLVKDNPALLQGVWAAPAAKGKLKIKVGADLWKTQRGRATMIDHLKTWVANRKEVAGETWKLGKMRQDETGKWIGVSVTKGSKQYNAFLVQNRLHVMTGFPDGPVKTYPIGKTLAGLKAGLSRAFPFAD